MPRITLTALLFASLSIGSSVAQTNSQTNSRLNSRTNSQASGVIGQWREPGGSMIQVHPCGNQICARLVSIAPDAPSPFDIHNPDTAQRTRRLCGLQIGWGFHRNDPDHATEGTLYDPKTGKAYHGKMTAAGDRLDLRGYVGLSIFGRTEVWTRTNQTAPPCPH